jgi:ribonuclease P protein component
MRDAVRCPEATVFRTIKSSREIDALFGTGSRAAGSHVMVLARPTPQERGPEGRVAFIAGKKLGSAVSRNRCKRVMREAARRAGAPWRGLDVALVARPSVVTAASDHVAAEVGSLVRRLLERQQ